MAVRPIPLEDFFRRPERIAPKVSPGGHRIAYLAPWKRRLNIHVQDLETGEVTRATSDGDRDLLDYSWVSDGRLLYAQDKGGDENFRLYAVDCDGSNAVDLTPFDEVQCRIVDELEEVEGKLLFAMNRRNKEIFDVYRLDTNTGAMELVVENPGNHEEWLVDHDGRLRVAVTTDGVNKSILYRETEQEEWRTIANYTFKEGAAPLKFTADNSALYVASNVGRDKTAIFEYDLESGKEIALIYEHPEVDVHHLLWSKKHKKVLGVRFEVDRPEFHFFDDRRRAIQEALDRELPDTLNALVSSSRDENTFVVRAGSDRHRGTYHLFDSERMKLTALFEAAPWLKPDEMASVEPIAYEARDGRKIRGYLVLPAGREPKGLPLIVHPHGGPWARDEWGFRNEEQFLANRGYAVLKMNFRGSTGFGREFMESSFGQWGLTMQDDVTDGVKWAIAQGIADPDRVAIYGGSYGGYATLSGLVKTPELYACGISYVGVSNIFTWLAAFPPYWKPYLEMVHEMVGHPERDAERLRETSPWFHADRIRAPLLVVQGANDPRVKQQESDQMVAALRERGVEVEYLVRENEGHGFLIEENQFDFYRAMETFLAKHLGAA
ncbi:MAG: S9 family peptidase [Planctomycetota bacterium]|jgi:dipeptidyl aminopeptidase/acylaminoacyl peptidase